MQVSVSEMEAGLRNEGNLYLRSYLSTLQPALPAVTENTTADDRSRNLLTGCESLPFTITLGYCSTVDLKKEAFFPWHVSTKNGSKC